MTFDAFSREVVRGGAGTVATRRAGSGPAVLLLHGYPETSLAWRKVAPDLANNFTVIAAIFQAMASQRFPTTQWTMAA